MPGAFIRGNRTFSQNVGIFGEIFEDCRIWLHTTTLLMFCSWKHQHLQSRKKFIMKHALLFIWLPPHLSINQYLSICLSVCLSVCPYTYLSVSVWLCTLSTCMSFCCCWLLPVSLLFLTCFALYLPNTLLNCVQSSWSRTVLPTSACPKLISGTKTLGSVLSTGALGRCGMQILFVIKIWLISSLYYRFAIICSGR